MSCYKDSRIRCLLLPGLVAAFLLSAQASAQEWARKMFDQTSHDFGVVARGAKVEHRFTVENIYEEDVRIASIRSTCGCTATEITKRHLKTWEKAEIVATLDTRSFLGRKDSTLTVVLDLPFPAEVQLQVHSYIRSDVVVQPGAVQFGSVNQGASAERRLTVSYAGRGDWRIERVECSNPLLQVELTEAGRTSGQVVYDLIVRLSGEAPVGYVRDQLVLITNDRNTRASRVPVAVEGLVVSSISIRPSPLMLGVLASGQSVTRRLVVQGQEPFRITAVECDDPRFAFSVDDEAKSVHLVSVTFTAGPELGQVESTLRIATDLGSNGRPEAGVQAIVAPAQADRTLPQR
ncbi:MAG: DUF1573 domain-containing protein [Thermoguttaceae bacterium]|jgi:hypothetical protein|nr:DUF1573 domain-containing protein [Thermoguttaceae bacterium]